MSVGGGMGCSTQSSLQYSPLLSLNLKRVFARTLVVRVLALPPPFDEASVAAT